MQHSCLLLWKMVHLGAPGHLIDRIDVKDDWKVETTVTRLQLTSKGYRWKTSLLWNELPDQLREEVRISRFKKGLKKLDC